MIEVRRHDQRDYATLPDIDIPGVGSLTENDILCLSDVGELILVKNVSSRFGITLLHSHFPMHDAEILVEQIDENNRRRTLSRPINVVSSSAESFTPINFKFDTEKSGDRLQLMALDHVPRVMLPSDVRISSDNEDEDVLRGIRSVLERHRCLERFGVGLVYDLIGRRSNEILMEACDPINRTLRCELINVATVNPATSVGTVWYWPGIESAESGSADQSTAGQTPPREPSKPLMPEPPRRCPTISVKRCEILTQPPWHRTFYQNKHENDPD